MTEQVLFVDDDVKILDAYRRQLGERYGIHTALGPEEGLKAINTEGPYAVIVSDMRMPGMDGIQFLKCAQRETPQSVRIMLTGHADLNTAVEAVNEGNIFRFLSKPCRADVLSHVLDTAIEQYRLQTLEKELLENTLRGSIKVLSEILSLVNPVAFGRVSRIRPLAERIGQELMIAEPWQLEVAVMISQLGCVTVPEEVLEKIGRGTSLLPHEQRAFDSHPAVGGSLIANIPRLEEVARIVAYQQKGFDGTGVPNDACQGDQIPLGARVLKLLLDYDLYESRGRSALDALKEIRRHRDRYDPQVIAALETTLDARSSIAVRAVKLADLEDGLVLAADVQAITGKLVASKGHEVTPSLRQRLINFSRNTPLQEPLYVMTNK